MPTGKYVRDTFLAFTDEVDAERQVRRDGGHNGTVLVNAYQH